MGTDGKVSAAVQAFEQMKNVGSQSTTEINLGSASAKISDTLIAHTYRDTSNYPRTFVMTVDPIYTPTPTRGSELVIESISSAVLGIDKVTDNRFAVLYSTTTQLKLAIVNISGLTCTIANTVVLATVSSFVDKAKVVNISDSKMLVVFRDTATNNMLTIVVTVSGGGVGTAGSQYQLDTTNSWPLEVISTENDQAVVAYLKYTGGNYYKKLLALSVVGTVVSAGSVFDIAFDNSTYNLALGMFDAQRLIVYDNNSGWLRLVAKAGLVLSTIKTFSSPSTSFTGFARMSSTKVVAFYDSALCPISLQEPDSLLIGNVVSPQSSSRREFKVIPLNGFTVFSTGFILNQFLEVFYHKLRYVNVYGVTNSDAVVDGPVRVKMFV